MGDASRLVAFGWNRVPMQFESMWAKTEPLPKCEVPLDDDSTTTVRPHGNAVSLRLILSRGNGLAVDVGYL